MPTTITLWRLSESGSATPVAEERLSAEVLIESAVESAPELLGDEVLIVGRQVPTPSGPLDLLAIDAEGRLVVIENKRDRTPRDVLAQTLDYAAYVTTLTFDDVAIIFESYRLRTGTRETDLGSAYEERFGDQLDAIAAPPAMIIVASRLDDSTERMIGFLADGFGVPINAALFQPFAGGLIGRTWLRPDEPSRSAGRLAAHSQSRDEAKIFWDAWLPIGRAALPKIKLPAHGPRSPFIKRRVEGGVPAAFAVWVATNDAYAEVHFDDDDPSLNELTLDALRDNRSSIEASFGTPLEWLGLGGQVTKRTKVVTPKVSIGHRTEPTPEGLHALADVATRLVAAVQPHLHDLYDTALGQLEDGDVVDDDMVIDGLVLEGRSGDSLSV